MIASRGVPARGIVLLVAVLALGLGIGARSSALSGVALFWAALLVLARAHGRARIGGLEAGRDVFPSAFEGEEVRVDLALATRKGAADLVEVTDAFGPAIADRQAVLEPGPLPARRRRHLRYTTTCSRHWGVYAVGPLQVSVSDALGLFAFSRIAEGAVPFTVFPRVHEVAALARLGARPSLAPQDVTGARAGAALEWLGLRDYRPGDEPRRVHWPATARRGAPVVKEMELDLVPFTTVFLDLERRHRAGTGLKSTLEYLVRTAASLVWTAVRRGDVLRLLAEGSRPLALPAGSGPAHLAFALDELVRVRQDGAVPLLDLAESHGEALPYGSTAVLLCGTTDLPLDRLGTLLDAWRARRVSAAVVAVDSESFVAIDRLAVSPAEAQRRRADLVAAVRAHGAGAVVLGAEHDLPETLPRPDLLEIA